MTEPVSRNRESRFAINYLTRYAYGADVVDNVNALRVKPASNGRQHVEEFSVRVTPDARQYRHEDYFGTEVVEFEISRPHDELVIDVRARVVTQPQPEPSGTTWEQLQSPNYREAGGEFLLQTDDVPGDPLLTELRSQIGAATTPLGAVQLAYALIPDQFAYRPGVTYVDSTLADVLATRAGVCQDFVHLGLNLLRHHGIAARYVSGYLFAESHEHAGTIAPGQTQSVEVDTHAWIEALLPADGDEPFWVSIDPTNRSLAGDRHVKIGHGRCYSDIPPIKGVYRGSAGSRLDACVTMTRFEGPDATNSARA